MEQLDALLHCYRDAGLCVFGVVKLRCTCLIQASQYTVTAKLLMLPHCRALSSCMHSCVPVALTGRKGWFSVVTESWAFYTFTDVSNTCVIWAVIVLDMTNSTLMQEPDVPLWVSDSAQDFLSKSLVKDPAKRSKASDLVKHPWLKSLGLKAPASQIPSSVAVVTPVLQPRVVIPEPEPVLEISHLTVTDEPVVEEEIVEASPIEIAVSASGNAWTGSHVSSWKRCCLGSPKCQVWVTMHYKNIAILLCNLLPGKHRIAHAHLVPAIIHLFVDFSLLYLHPFMQASLFWLA